MLSFFYLGHLQKISSDCLPRISQAEPGKQSCFFGGGASASEIQFLLGRLQSLWLSSLRSFPFPSVEARSAQWVPGWLVWNSTAAVLTEGSRLGGSLLGQIFSEKRFTFRRETAKGPLGTKHKHRLGDSGRLDG